MPRIYRYYYFRTYNKEISEDLSSELSLKVFRSLGIKKFNEKTFYIWIYKIAKNLLIDHYRKKGNIKEVNVKPEWESVIDSDQMIKRSAYLARELGIKNERLFKAIENLTDLQKDIIVMKFIEDLDYSSISKITGKSQNTLRGIIFRAIRAIKAEMG